jgi:hypothetical protein
MATAVFVLHASQYADAILEDLRGAAWHSKSSIRSQFVRSAATATATATLVTGTVSQLRRGYSTSARHAPPFLSEFPANSMLRVEIHTPNSQVVFRNS